MSPEIHPIPSQHKGAPELGKRQLPRSGLKSPKVRDSSLEGLNHTSRQLETTNDVPFCVLAITLQLTNEYLDRNPLLCASNSYLM